MKEKKARAQKTSNFRESKVSLVSYIIRRSVRLPITANNCLQSGYGVFLIFKGSKRG